MKDRVQLNEPKTVVITDGSGRQKEYIISKFPAFQGQEIMELLPTSAIMNLIPKLANVKVSREARLRLMSYVAVDINDGCITILDTETLINNHITDWEALTKLQAEMIMYNASFLRDGRILDFLKDCAQIHIPKIIETLMALLEQSLQAEKQVSTN